MLMGRVRSFGYAFKGLGTMVASQQNAWIHAVATLVVVLAGLRFDLSIVEWCLVVLTITLVWAAEALNTALEFLTDLASPDYHPLAAKAKDIAAGGVLITAIGSVLIGILIFGPYVMRSVKAES